MQDRTTLPAEPASSSTPWNDIALFLAIFVFAFGVRLLYLFEIESIPFFYQLVGDARSYDEWAQRIAAGEWLGRGVFYQAPLYPYFLGLLQLTLGRDLWSIRVVQILLGAASCSLVYWAGRSFLSQEAGIAAGLVLSLYAPAIFFDGLIQKTALDLFLITLLLCLLGGTQRRPHWSRWVATGGVLGLLGLTRENALIWLFVVPIWIWLGFAEHRPGPRLGWIGMFLVGVSLVLFPVGLRNLTVGGEFTLTTSQLGPNFFIGNNPGASGAYAPLRAGHGNPQHESRDATELAERALGRALSPGEVSGYWLRRSWNYIRSQPLDWLRLMARKWLLVWNVRELEDTEDFYLYQRWSWLLGVLGAINHFGVLAPLAAMGVLLTWRQWRRLWILYALLLTLAFSVALFYVFGRYRFPMVPLLALFAGAGLAQGLALYRERRVQRALAYAVVLSLAVAVVYWAVMGKPEPSSAALNNLGYALAKQGRINKAIESYRLALWVQPSYAVAHHNLASLLAQQGKLEEATHHYQAAVRFYPDYMEAHHDLGVALARQGELAEAIGHFRQALRIQPEFTQAQESLSRALAQRGKRDETIQPDQDTLRMMKSRPKGTAR